MTNLDYLYNPNYAKFFLNKNYFVNKKLSFKIIEHGMILPYKDTSTPQKWTFGAGGIVDSRGKIVRNTFLHSGYDEAYIPPKESIQYSSETVVYLGVFYPVWGHVLTDDIRRLWFLKSDIFKREFKDFPLVYVPKLLGNAYPNFIRLLNILDINFYRLKEINQPTKFKRIILPDESFINSNSFTNEYRETIDRVRNFAFKNRTLTTFKKIYYLHDVQNRSGEKRLAEYFQSKGYKIISPEKLTLDEQLNILINCESFASTAGSCSHNSVFLRDGTETIFIPRSLYEYCPYQFILDQVHSLNVNYVDSSLSIFFKANKNPCYIISPHLKKFFDDKFNSYEEGDFENFLRYVKNSLDEGFVVDPRADIFYGSIFSNFIKQLKRHVNLVISYNLPPYSEEFQSSLPKRLAYQTHIDVKGWHDGWKSENEFSNPLDQNLEVLAIKLNYPNHKVYYSVYFNDVEGWSEEVQAPEMAGTVGKHKPIFSMRIRLDEAGTKNFDILYRMHKLDDTWTPWAKNGEALYSYGVKLNAIQVKLQPKSDAAKT